MGMDFKLITQYVANIEITGDLLEIGSNKGEHSTDELIKIAANNHKILHSVDMNQGIIEHNKNIYCNLPVKFYNLKGEDFLDQYTNLKFSIILLDNFDWNWWINRPHTVTPGWFDDLQNDYKKTYNLDMTNINSQIAHLTQAIKLSTMMTDECVVICDDTVFNHNETYDGKCGAAVPYLMTLGFKPHIVLSDTSKPMGVVLIRQVKKNTGTF